MSDEIGQKWHGLRFGVSRSIRYHTRRRRFFERWNRTTLFLSVVFGSTAVASLFGKNTGFAASAAVIVSVASAFDLVVGTTREAWSHAELAKRFIKLLAEINRSTQTEDELIRLTNERLEIESDEPPVLHVLNAICHNEEMRALGYKPNELARIEFLSRMLANFFDFRERKITPPDSQT